MLSWEGGRRMSPPGSVPTHPPCLVPTPRQSALSRALLQPNAWAAATVARVAGPGLVKPVGTDLKGAEGPRTLGWMSGCSLQLVVGGGRHVDLLVNPDTLKVTGFNWFSPTFPMAPSEA